MIGYVQEMQNAADLHARNILLVGHHYIIPAYNWPCMHGQQGQGPIYWGTGGKG